MKRFDARAASANAAALEAEAVVASGGVLVFPTDTVYGIGCDPARPEAIARIYRLKGRPATKPLSLHCGSVDALLAYAAGNALAARAAAAFLPGPLTLIVARPASVDAAVTAGLGSLGLRVPDHALCRDILLRCGPLAGTSANFSGEPAFSGGAATGALPDADVWIDDGPTPHRAESTIVDVSADVPCLVREGVITVQELERHLGPVRPARTAAAGERA